MSASVTPEAMAASVSAVCALVTLYLYRAQGFGFVWTKNPAVNLVVLPNGTLQLSVLIPLFNLGTGNLRFLELRAKRVHLKTNSVEPFSVDMAEAYFPPGTEIVTYRTPVFQDIPLPANGATSQLLVVGPSKATQLEPAAYQDAINEKVQSVGEVLFVLKCKYKNGSWLGLRAQTTTIAMCLSGTNLTYLSNSREKELANLLNWD